MDVQHVENVVIKSSKWREEDIPLLFGDEPVFFAESTTLQHLMKELGVFRSTSEAIRAGRTGNVPSGFTDAYKASKKRRLWIWNPTE